MDQQLSFPGVEKDNLIAKEIARKNSLANLRKFKPGESGNPKGRKIGGEYAQEALNRFMTHDNETGLPLFTHDELEFIAKHSASDAERMAANRILVASRDPMKWVKDKNGKLHSAGIDPEPGKAFDAILDRLVGRPLNKIEKTVEVVERPSEIEQKIAKLLAHHPQVRSLLQRKLHLVEQPEELKQLTGAAEKIRASAASPVEADEGT